MAEDQIQYDVLAQEALRGVVRTVLRDVARTGLPGDHHFYIAFDTRAEGVSVSKRLKEKYADEMTIVLQYQFWDLEVSDERFEFEFGRIHVDGSLTDTRDVEHVVDQGEQVHPVLPDPPEVPEVGR